MVSVWKFKSQIIKGLKKVIRGHFSNSILFSEPCLKLHDFLPKDVSFK